MNALAKIGGTAIETVLNALPEDTGLRLLDKLLDAAEDAIEASPTQVDDVLALPVIRFLRSQLGIPDGD